MGSQVSVAGQECEKDYNNTIVGLMLQGLFSFSDPMADVPVHAHSIGNFASSQPVLQLLMFSLILQAAAKTQDFYFRQ